MATRRNAALVSPVLSLAEFSLEDFAARVEAWGGRPVHARQILRSFYEGDGTVGWADFELPRPLRGRIEAELRATPAELAARQVAEDGTTKLLLRLGDGRTVEAVLMPDWQGGRAAGCLSSQVGCAMGCDFCATAQGGFARNLSVGEIVEQFLALRREARAVGRKLQTIVFMGMGEPMLNLDPVIEAARRIAANDLGALGRKQITISTVGLVPGIEALAASGLGVSLAVSLHASDDVTRARLLPAGRRYGVAEILAAADRYQAATGQITTIQYCLLAGVNDSPAQARALAALMAGRRMHVNLLRYNPTGPGLSGFAYQPPEMADIEAFLGELRAQGVVAHFRRPRGEGIDAACGQLRGRVELQ
ncbi:MAG: 23S rRNA (adenine(2503)-C(2))-methyltransferase RlmN [Opitutaceae bacterium]|nr:23S rRNA (adenine(2503)-C(2))-methyltransferase RlmN [Opitutaceae bacterium]